MSTSHKICIFLPYFDPFFVFYLFFDLSLTYSGPIDWLAGAARPTILDFLDHIVSHSQQSTACHRIGQQQVPRRKSLLDQASYFPPKTYRSWSVCNKHEASGERFLD
jgi:hypothetical protein